MTTAARFRELIEYAEQVRRDLERLTIATFIAHEGVGNILSRTIANLKALDIPAALKAESVLRDAEIGACEDLMRRWLKARGQFYLLERMPVVDVTATLESLDGSQVETKSSTVHVYEPDERTYGRNGVYLRVIDGGKR